MAAFVEQVQQTGRPLVLTHHGKSAAVLLGAEEYEAMIDELEILRDVVVAQKELAEGKGIPHEEVVEELRKHLRSELAT